METLKHAGRNVNVNQHFRKHVGIIYQICSSSTARNMPDRYTCTYTTGETYKISQSSAIYNSLKREIHVSIYCRMYDLWFPYQRINDKKSQQRSTIQINLIMTPKARHKVIAHLYEVQKQTHKL